jgi:hypothetical protein
MKEKFAQRIKDRDEFEKRRDARRRVQLAKAMTKLTITEAKRSTGSNSSAKFGMPCFDAEAVSGSESEK